MKPLILITGSTGFVGSHVLKYLISNGFYCRVILKNSTKFNYENNKNIEQVFRTNNMFNENIEWWDKVCEDIDLIIHLAWYTNPDDYLISKDNYDCLTGSIRMFNSAINAKVKKIVSIGTCFEYDLNYGILSTSTPLLPTTSYSICKVSLYNILNNMATLHNFDYNWCRLFYLYGDGENPKKLSSYINDQLRNGEVANLSSGKQIRDYLDVKIAAEIIVKTSLQNMYSGPVNICSGIPISVKNFAESIAKKYNRSDLLKFDTRSDNLIDPLVVVGIPTIF